MWWLSKSCTHDKKLHLSGNTSISVLRDEEVLSNEHFNNNQHLCRSNSYSEKKNHTSMQLIHIQHFPKGNRLPFQAIILETNVYYFITAGNQNESLPSHLPPTCPWKASYIFPAFKMKPWHWHSITANPWLMTTIWTGISVIRQSGF